MLNIGHKNTNNSMYKINSFLSSIASFAILIFLLTVSSQALIASTPFYGPTLYESNGHVKEIKLSTKDRMAFNKKVKFTEEGQVNIRKMEYDDAGFPVGYDMSIGNNKIALDIRYNDQSRVDSISYIITMMRYVKLEFVNLYDESGLLVGRMARDYEKKDKEPILYEYRFSDYVNDDRGNWVSRRVVQRTMKPGKAPETEEYTETRTIKYF